MSWIASFYDLMMYPIERNCLGDWRAEILSDLKGKILEIGGGTGVNLDLYSKDVELLITEPDREMRERLLKKLTPEQREYISVTDAFLETLPVEDNSFDVVVSTLVLCSVRDLDKAVQEIYRIVKPGGKFVFLEHVAGEPHTTRFKWQQRLEPLWVAIASNCHMTRNTEEAIIKAGFNIQWILHDEFCFAPPLFPSIRGVAIK